MLMVQSRLEFEYLVGFPGLLETPEVFTKKNQTLVEKFLQPTWVWLTPFYTQLKAGTHIGTWALGFAWSLRKVTLKLTRKTEKPAGKSSDEEMWSNLIDNYALHRSHIASSCNYFGHRSDYVPSINVDLNTASVYVLFIGFHVRYY